MSHLLRMMILLRKSANAKGLLESARLRERATRRRRRTRARASAASSSPRHLSRRHHVPRPRGHPTAPRSACPQPRSRPRVKPASTTNSSRRGNRNRAPARRRCPKSLAEQRSWAPRARRRAGSREPGYPASERMSRRSTRSLSRHFRRLQMHLRIYQSRRWHPSTPRRTLCLRR